MMNRQAGFTLLELLITLIVAIVLMAVAIPSFVSFIQSNRVTGLTNQMVTALNVARSEAIRRVEAVELCVYNGDPEDPDCAGDANWARGWVVRVATGDDRGTVIRVWELDTPAGVTLARLESGSSQNVVQYDPRGRVVTLAQGERMLWRVQGNRCTAGAAGARMVEVNRVGRPQAREGTCG